MGIPVQRAFRFAIAPLVCSAVLIGAAALFGQQALDNDAVVKLVKARLSENIILAIVKNQPGHYSMAADDVVRLKNAGVPNAIIAAMLDKQYGLPEGQRFSPNSSISSSASHLSWKNTPVSQWREEDAKQLLADSPWSRNVQLDVVRNLSLFERRDGGDWDVGIGTGYGLAAVGFGGDWKEAQTLEHEHERAGLGMVVVRWESASPVRAAESKAGDTSVPDWVGDYYAIAVHGVPLPPHWKQTSELKGLAALKRDNKKDVKPSSVVVLPGADGLSTLVYLFPRSTEITKKDGGVGFVAQIGRLFVFASFIPEDMQLGDKLQL